MRTLKLVISILSCVLVLFIVFQSCSASLVSSIQQTDDISGSAGIFLAIFLLVAGITAIAGRDSMGATIAAAVLYILGGVLGLVGKGIYGDLEIWSWLSIIFGGVFLLSLPGMGASASAAAPVGAPQYAAAAAPGFAPDPATLRYVSVSEGSAVDRPRVSKWLRVIGCANIVACVGVGLSWSYRYLLPVVVAHTNLGYYACIAAALILGGIVSGVFGSAVSGVLFGLACIIDRLYNSAQK